MKLNEVSIKQLCDIAKKAAVEAGEYIQSQLNKQYTSKRKVGGNSLASQVVTEVDEKAQAIILNHLANSIQQYDLGLLTEEAADDTSRLTKDYFWCVDPLDGTLPFTEGRTGYAVSIALVTQAGDPIIGVVYVPDLADCYAAIKGRGVQLNEQAFLPAISDKQKLHFYMDRSLKAEPNFEPILAQMEAWASSTYQATVQQHIGYGAVRNALGVLHAGLGCYFKLPKSALGGGSIWDFAATRLFFEEAGRYISNAVGEKLHLNQAKNTFMNELGVVYASDRIIYDKLYKMYSID